ncbi:hypothetical protein [Salinimicrobium marinum]|nr:hypothetical protein [Salinimicrobium marinum]
MAVEETIAVVGLRSDKPSVFVDKIKNQHVRLLVIPAEEGEKVSLNKFFKNNLTNAEIEVLDCARDGCWEADIITFLDPVDPEESLLNRIKEVAVQKPVLFIFEEASAEADAKAEKLQKKLSNSIILKIKIDDEKERAIISGTDPQSIEQVSEMLNRAGFTVKA